MSLLASLVASSRRELPPRVLVYGQPKVGKTTFACGAPAPLLIQLEDGATELDVPATGVLSEWARVMGILGELIETDHAYQSVIIDSIDALEPIIHAYVCDRENVKNIEALGYGKGYVLAAAEWRDFFEAIGALRARAITVILIAHEQTITISPPDSAAYSASVPKLHKSAMALAQEQVDVIARAEPRVIVTAQADDKKGQKLGRATGINDERILRVGSSPARVTGSRRSLPDTLPLDWGSFAAAWAAASPEKKNA